MPFDINSTDDLNDLLSLARSIGREGGNILRSYYRGEENLAVNEDKKDGPVTSADLAVNSYILSELRSHLGDTDFAYITEETYRYGDLNRDPAWIIDPLDGTRDFIDKTGEYALHIALCHGHRPILAVVVVPEAEKLYFAIKDGGSFVESGGEIHRLRVSPPKNTIEELYLVASRSHRDRRFQELLDRIPFKGRNYVGSVGCKIANILEGRSDVYVYLSGKSAAKDWDFAAPELILTEAGGKFTYFEGSPVLYNRVDPSQWGGIIATNGSCHEELCREAIKIMHDVYAGDLPYLPF